MFDRFEAKQIISPSLGPLFLTASKRLWKPAPRAVFAAVMGLGLWLLWAPAVQASVPPLNVALQAVGEASDDRSDGDWTLTVSDGGIETFCGESNEDGGRAFGDGEESIQIAEQADEPWRLVWAMLWSSVPADDLEQFAGDWGDQTGRVEVFDGNMVHCYGERSRMCVDEQLRRIAILEVSIDDIDWALRVTSDGQRLQVIRDGSPVARLSADGRC